MSKRKAIFGAAAGLFIAAAGALTISQSLNQASDEHPGGGFGPNQWDSQASKLAQNETDFFVLMLDGYSPPEAVAFPIKGDRFLGDCRQSWQYGLDDGLTHNAAYCASNPCTPTFGACFIRTPGNDYVYPWLRTSATQAVRLFRGRAHNWVIGGWKQLAATDANVTFAGARKDVFAACTGLGLGNGQCRDLLSKADDCWLLASGNMCRYGLEYGPGLGGVDAAGVPATCSPINSSTWMACSVRAGQDALTLSTTEDMPADDQLDMDPPPSGGD